MKITAPAFAYSSASFHSLGIFQNFTNIPFFSISLSFPSNFFHKSWLATGLPVNVFHSFLRHSKIHSEMPLTTYSESHANTILEKPSPAEYFGLSEANTARSSARLLVCGFPSCSRRPEIGEEHSRGANTTP